MTEDMARLHEKVGALEANMSILADSLRATGEVLATHIKAEERFQDTLQEAMLENVKTSSRLHDRLDALVLELKEPLEDFRVRKYGNLWIAGWVAKSKALVWALGVASILGVVSIGDHGWEVLKTIFDIIK
jgi:hypothetical protein